MLMCAAMAIPQQLRAGDTWSWTDDFSSYPADAGWSLSHILLPTSGSGVKVTVSSAASGKSFVSSASATATAAYSATEYRYVARVSLSGEVHTVSNGTVTVLPDLSALDVLDSRSTAVKALAKIDAWLSGVKSLDVASYQINNRSISSHSLPDLILLRDRLREEVAAERMAQKLAAGAGDQRNIYVRFA